MKQYQDNFAHFHLPEKEFQPDYLFNHADFELDNSLNCVERLLDIHIKEERGEAIAIRTFDETWTFQDLYDKSNQIAHVLIDDLGFVSGNRVLIRSANNPMFVACWFAVLKAGGIVVATMPLLREKELETIIECSEITHSFCDIRLEEALSLVKSSFLKSICTFDGSNETKSELEVLMASKSKEFTNFPTFAEAVSIIGFTSGTTVYRK